MDPGSRKGAVLGKGPPQQVEWTPPPPPPLDQPDSETAMYWGGYAGQPDGSGRQMADHNPWYATRGNVGSPEQHWGHQSTGEAIYQPQYHPLGHVPVRTQGNGAIYQTQHWGGLTGQDVCAGSEYR